MRASTQFHLREVAHVELGAPPNHLGLRADQTALEIGPIDGGSVIDDAVGDDTPLE